MASEIIVSINVQSGKAEVNLGKAKKGVDKLSAAHHKLAEANADVAIEIAKVNLQTKRQIQVNNQNAAQLLKTSNKTSGAFRTQVGLNNAILTEAGRAASDFKYGFNGIANNLGQLSSLMGSLIQTSDNVGTSLKRLLKDIVGVGGLLVAFQLLIAYGDQIYNFFRGVTEAAAKAEKAMKKLEGTIQSQRRELLGYIEVLDESNVSEEVRINALKELNVISKETVQDYKDGKIELDELTLSVETYIKQQRLRGELETILSSNKEVFAEREKIISVQRQLNLAKEEGDVEKVKEIYKKNASWFEQLDLSKDGLLGAFFNPDADLAGLFKKQNKAVIDEAESAMTRMKEIMLQLTANANGGGGNGGDTRIRIFKEKTLELEKLEQKYREKSVNKDLQTNQEKIAQFQQNEFAKLDILEESFITRESLRLKNYIESIENQKISDDKKLVLIADAEAKFTKEIEQAGEDRLEVEKQILINSQLMRDIQDRKNGEIGRKLQEKEERIREAFNYRRVEALKTGVGDDAIYFNAKAVLLERDIDRQQRITDSYKLGTVERAEAEVEFYRLKERLRQNDQEKEIAAAEAKKSIQMEYVGFAQGISSILGNIDKGNEDLRKAALVIEKGASIANIVIKARAANAISIAADTASGGLTTPVNAPLRLRNNISAGISIASILATTISSFKTPSSGGGGSGSGSGANVSAPSFNVVGASATNQLAQTVAGQVNAPLRAYVVGSDISDQQELDRSIISTAGIG